MDLQQIKELMHELEQSRLRKLVLKRGDFELYLEKGAVAEARPLPSEPEPVFQSEAALKKASQAGTYVSSPMVGTFYATPAPDQPPFVKVGDRVSENTVVCIVEAMKVMNEVKAGLSGTVAEVLVNNSQPVEFGTRLFRIV